MLPHIDRNFNVLLDVMHSTTITAVLLCVTGYIFMCKIGPLLGAGPILVCSGVNGALLLKITPWVGLFLDAKPQRGRRSVKIF